MADHVLIDSPYGPLAFSLDQVREASVRANEMATALDLLPKATATPRAAGEAAAWLSVEEVAERTGLKASWLYQEIRANRLPNRHFGRQVRIPSSYLREPDTKSSAHRAGGQ